MKHIARRAAATAAATAALFAVSVGAASLADAATPTPAANSTNYSLTQTVDNNTDQPMTLVSSQVDNRGKLQPGYPTVIQAGDTGTYVGTNYGNGLQMWLTFTTPDGATVTTDSDVPKTNQNWTTDYVTADGMVAGDMSIGGGDNPTAAFTVYSTPTNGVVHTGGTAYSSNNLPPVR